VLSDKLKEIYRYRSNTLSRENLWTL
jgi:hypothetical protein